MKRHQREASAVSAHPAANPRLAGVSRIANIRDPAKPMLVRSTILESRDQVNPVVWWPMIDMLSVARLIKIKKPMPQPSSPQRRRKQKTMLI